MKNDNLRNEQNSEYDNIAIEPISYELSEDMKIYLEMIELVKKIVYECTGVPKEMLGSSKI